MAITINRLVLDLSHHETVQDWDKVKGDGIVGIIYKATQGRSYTDPTYWTARAHALGEGLIWGSYHFGENGDVAKQVDNYLSYAEPSVSDLFCLDLEDYGSKSMTLAQAKEFIEAVEWKLGRPTECVIYSGNTIKEMLGKKVDSFWGARRLWLAQYSTKPSVQNSWDTYWLWQYSDGEEGPMPHDVDGINDMVDSNHFDGSPEDLLVQWSGGQKPTPPPEPEKSVVKIIVQAPPNVKVEVRQT